jgi:hypothetical protein
VTLHANDIIKTLRNFVVKRQHNKPTKPKPSGAAGAGAADDSDFLLGADPSATSAAAAADGGASLLKTAVATAKAARRRATEKQFWQALGNSVGEHTERVWSALDSGLRKYNSLLEERAGLIEETTELARQNEELKILLQVYYCDLLSLLSFFLSYHCSHSALVCCMSCCAVRLPMCRSICLPKSTLNSLFPPPVSFGLTRRSPVFRQTSFFFPIVCRPRANVACASAPHRLRPGAQAAAPNELQRASVPARVGARLWQDGGAESALGGPCKIACASFRSRER